MAPPGALFMMDIHFYFNRWLLFMALMLLIHQCQDVHGVADQRRPCPQGQIIHQTQQFLSCCLPTRCGVGFEVKPCTTNGTNDKCEACGPFTNQSRRTSSFTMKKNCVDWHLNDKCKSRKDNVLKPDDPDTQRCLCDVEEGFKFERPESSFYGAPREAYCQASRKPCDPGYEPTIQGDCVPCEQNHFKANKGYQLCEPKTDCALLGLKLLHHHDDATLDFNCSEPEVFPTPVIKVKSTTSEPVTKEENSITTPPQGVVSATTLTEDPLKTLSSQNTKDHQDDDSVPVWTIVLAIIFVLVVAVVIGFILFLRRRRIPLCSCFKDSEKYGVTHCPSSLPVGDHHHKNGPSGDRFIEPQMTQGEKVMNNNVNGGLIVDSPNVSNLQRPPPHAQHNGNFVQFSSGPESSDSETQMHFQNQQNSFQANVLPPITGRPGILRNGNTKAPYHQGQQVAFAQAFVATARTPAQDASIDSIGREKLHVNVDRYQQANQELGESDPLLIADESSSAASAGGGGVCQGVVFQNRAAGGGGGMMTNHSPPVQQAAGTPNQVVFLPPNANFSNAHCQNVAGGYVHPVSGMNQPPNMSGSSGSTSSGSSSPAVVQQPTQAQQHQVTFAPTLNTVTYKRSLSVIANPEGEAEEEELEANVPRFSQLLPADGEDPSSSSFTPSPSNPILRMAQERETLAALDSPQREMTHQARAPSERLQNRPPQNPLLAPNFVIHAAPEQPVGGRHHHPQLLNFHRPYFTGQGRHPSSSSTENDAADHCIMELKEHQLANSLSSSSSAANNSGETMLKHTADTQFNLEDFTASSNQMDAKTLGGTIKEEQDNSPGAAATSKKAKPAFSGVASTTVPQNTNIEDGHEAGVTPVENKKPPRGNISTDRKRMPSDNNAGVTNSDERHRVPSGDKQQKSCLRNFPSQEEGDCAVNKRPAPRLGRGVSFEDEEGKRDNGSLGHDTEPKQIRDSFPYQDENVDCNFEEKENRKVRRSDSNGDDTDLSSSESAHGSPSRSNTYRRSQSESTSGTDTGHKPPPRSMSEEKSQKADRPIAKVKPMPASDSSVNQVPAGSGVSEGNNTEDSGDESSFESSAPDLQAGNPGDVADDELDTLPGEQEREERQQ